MVNNHATTHWESITIIKGQSRFAQLKEKFAHKDCWEGIEKMSHTRGTLEQLGSQFFFPKFPPGTRDRPKTGHANTSSDTKKKAIFSPASPRWLMPACTGKNPSHRGINLNPHFRSPCGQECNLHSVCFVGGNWFWQLVSIHVLLLGKNAGAVCIMKLANRPRLHL